MHEKPAKLASFFDPLSVAEAIAAAVEAREDYTASDTSLPPARAAVSHTVDDHAVLRSLLPGELYDFWRESGYAGMYSMTFLLRHAVSFLALAAHAKACPPWHECSGFLAGFLEANFPGRHTVPVQVFLDALCRRPALLEPIMEFRMPVAGFSPLGIHLQYLDRGRCRAFDYYDIRSCPKPAEGLFCPEHSAEAWWLAETNKASTQAAMFRFYAEKDNINRYDERELLELVGRFWPQFRRTRRLPREARSLDEALRYFGYASLSECRADGQVNVRRRYAQRARTLHPDAGGRHASFVQLQKHYGVLRSVLQYDRAGLL